MWSLSKRTLLFLLAVFLVAFVFRSQNFAGGIQFDSDFGRDSLFAMRILQGDPTLLGPQASVGGFYLGPLYYYLVAAVYAVVGYTPAAVSVVFLLMGALTVVLGFVVLKRHVSTLAGVLFVLFSLAHPAFVMASRSATNQPMMPLSAVLFVGVFLEAIRRQQLRWMFASGLACGLFFHVHFSSMLLLPAIGLLLFTQVKGTLQRKLTGFVIFSLAVVLLLSPLILFDVTHGFVTSKAFLAYLTSSASGDALAGDHPHLSLLEKIMRIGWFTIRQPMLLVLTLVGSVATLRVHRKELAYRDPLWSLVLLSLGSLGMLLLYRGYLYDYYLLIPMTTFLMTLAALLSKLSHKFAVLILGLFILLTSASSLRFPTAYRIVPNLSKVTDRIIADVDATGERNFTIFKDTTDRLTGLGYEYRFLLAREGYVPVHELSYDSATVLYYIQEEGTKDPLISTNWETTQFGATKKELIEDIAIANWKVKLWRLTK